MQERQQRAGAAEKSFAAGGIGTAGVIDEFGPAVAVAREREHRFQHHRSTGAVEARDQIVPGDVEPQILGLINQARAVLETQDQDRTAAIMRV